MGLIGFDFGFINLSNAFIDRLRVPKYHFKAPNKRTAFTNKFFYRPKDNNNYLESISYPGGFNVNYTYNDFGQLTSVSDSSGKTVSYEYHPEASPGGSANISSPRELNGNTGGYLKRSSTSLGAAQNWDNYTYDLRGNLQTSSSTTGTNASYVVNNYDEVVSENVTSSFTNSLSPMSFSGSYEYYKNGNLKIEATTHGTGDTAVSNTSSYTYTLSNMVNTVTESNRGTTTYTYDNNDNVLSIVSPGGNMSFSYNNRDLIDSVTKGTCQDNPVSFFNYDGNGNVIHTTNPLNNSQTYAYDGFDRVRSVKDPLNNETVFSRAEFGNLLTVKKFDNSGNLLRETVTAKDLVGRVTSYTIKVPEGEDVNYTYTYENNGKTVTAIDSLGRVSQVYKNDLGQVIKEVDAAGNMTEYFYEDGRGNMTRKKETEVNGVEPITTRYTYNAFNKVETMTDSLGSEWLFTYDKQGNLSGTKDAEGNTGSHEYDSSGRRTKTTKYLSSGGKIERNFTYHDNNKLKTITDAGNNTTTYEYDCLNNLKKIIYPDNTFIEYSYDKNSNVISEKQRSGTIVTNTYDALNRLTNRSITRAQGVGGTSFENYGYDALSRLTQAENDFSSIERNYNGLNQLIEEKQMGKTINFTYDNLNNLKSIQYPSGRIIRRDFDSLNRISQVKEGTAAIADMSYIGRSYRMLSKQYGNGDIINFLYGQGRRLTSKEVRNANNDLINKYVYGYNKVNMKTFEQRVHDNNMGDIFSYDEVYRLKNIKFNSPEPAVPETEQFEKQKSYLFDKLDNILTLVETQNEETSEIANTLTGVNYQLNQYTTFDEWGLSYDGNGNTTQKGTQHFTYDYRNQLISATDLSTTVDYKYDAFGRRIEKITGSTATKYFYHANQVIEERDNSDQVLKQYIYGNGIDEIIRVDNYESGSPVAYYYYTNAIGSVTAITDDSGNLIERISYDTFGMPTFTNDSGNVISASSIGNEYLFHGRRYDKETNLYYYRARYYDPIMGRFLQTDPMGYEDSMNMYQGFNMNPVNFVDPWGEKLFAAGDIQTVLGWLEGIAGVQGVLKTKQPTIANSALVNAKEIYFASNQAIKKSSNAGLWLLDALIMSPQKYILGLGETYPTAYSPPNRKFNPRTKEGTVGQHFKLNWKSSSVGGALNPPKGIDCVIWFYLDSKYLNKVKKRHDIVINFQRGEVHYAHSVNGKTEPNGPLEKLYLFIFHELAEAYYELEKNLPYADAHQNAIDKEMDLRDQRKYTEKLRQDVDSGWLMRKFK